MANRTDAEHVRDIRRCKVGIDQAGPDPQSRERDREVYRHRRLANAALSAQDCDDRAVKPAANRPAIHEPAHVDFHRRTGTLVKQTGVEICCLLQGQGSFRKSNPDPVSLGGDRRRGNRRTSLTEAPTKRRADRLFSDHVYTPNCIAAVFEMNPAFS